MIKRLAEAGAFMHPRLLPEGDVFAARFESARYTRPDVALPRNLANPPITEALIDIRSPIRTDISAATFANVRSRLSARFPKVDEQHAFQAQFEVRDAQPRTQSKQLGFHGLHFKTSDGLTIAQFRRDGFTVNRLRPYFGWQTLFETAMELFPLYVEATRIERIGRIAVRYINHLNLPISSGSPLADNLTAVPPTPPGLPATLSAFLSRISLFDAEHTLQANFTQSLESVAGTDYPKVLLDIDAFADITETASLADVQLAEELNNLRELKNRIFFAALTERAVEFFT